MDEINPKNIREEAIRRLNDPEQAIQFMQDILAQHGKPPLSPETVERIRNNADGVRQHEAAEQAYEVMQGYLALKKRHPVAADEANMNRVAYFFLEEEHDEAAKARNDAFIESLETPQGRRNLFFRAVDYLDGQSEKHFFERDLNRLPQLFHDYTKLMGIGWVVDSCLTVWSRTLEMADVDPEIRQRLEEWRDVYECGGVIQNYVEFMQKPAYSSVSMLSWEEMENLTSSVSGLEKGLETQMGQLLSGTLSDGMGVKMELKDGPVEQMGRKLGEIGLLDGDVFFLDADGKRKKHLDAIKALTNGETVTIRLYADRHTDIGREYVCKQVDGELKLETTVCRREVKPDPAYPETLDHINPQLQAMWNHSTGVEYFVDGQICKQQQAANGLLQGKRVLINSYANDRDYLGKQEIFEYDPANPDQLKLVETAICSREVDLSGKIRNQQKQLEELERLQTVLSSSDPFYVSNSSDFNKVTKALDKLIRFQKNPAKAAAAPEGKLQELYADLHAKTDAYLKMKLEKTSQRTDDDTRGHLRYNTIGALKSLTAPDHAGRMAQQFLASLPQPAAEKAPVQRGRGGPQGPA